MKVDTINFITAFLLFTAICYLGLSFIIMDFNPFNWALYRYPEGRAFLLFIIIICFVLSCDFIRYMGKQSKNK